MKVYWKPSALACMHHLITDPYRAASGQRYRLIHYRQMTVGIDGAAYKEEWFGAIAGKGVVAFRRKEPDEESFRGLIPIS